MRSRSATPRRNKPVADVWRTATTSQRRAILEIAGIPEKWASVLRGMDWEELRPHVQSAIQDRWEAAANPVKQKLWRHILAYWVKPDPEGGEDYEIALFKDGWVGHKLASEAKFTILADKKQKRDFTELNQELLARGFRRAGVTEGWTQKQLKKERVYKTYFQFQTSEDHARAIQALREGFPVEMFRRFVYPLFEGRAIFVSDDQIVGASRMLNRAKIPYTTARHFKDVREVGVEPLLEAPLPEPKPRPTWWVHERPPIHTFHPNACPPPVAKVALYFKRVQEYISQHSPQLANISCQMFCPEIRAYRKQHPNIRGRRAFMHVEHHPDAICVWSPAAARLSKSHLVGLFLHEFGHLGSGGDDSAADRWVLVKIGLPIEYRGPLCLEWVSPAIIAERGI